MVLYNFASAFTICAIAFVIGEWVSNATKAWIPSVFVTACIMLVGYWTCFPREIVTNAGIMPFANTIGLFLIITHIGTIISIKQLIQQWRTIVVCLAGLAGMLIAGYYIGSLVMDRTLVIAGLPPLTGGIVAATIMKTAASNAGLTTASVFAITMYCVQGFAGYPLTAICLQLEGKKLLKKYHAGEVTLTPEQIKEMSGIGLTAIADDSHIKKLLPKLSDKINTPVFMLCKLAFVAWLAICAGQVTPINGAVWALIFGIIATHIGFLESNVLSRSTSYWIIMFGLMMFIFDGLKDCTPEMLASIIIPMILLIVIGVIGMGIMAFVISKILRMSFYLAFANGLTALYGFPCDAIITEMTCNSLTDDKVERGYLMSHMFPSMIVGGFVTVTFTSVLIAGYFATLF
ncbi:hypothetical protein [uncultured Megasphaera sp.]|uniref:hypothetical protein n=1 Tax=uncultured Megasphaera sp. TaxID=165188 RepID=UPI002658E2DC|nr:hypothetical protein [uncultured Megasphaera sp.]